MGDRHPPLGPELLLELPARGTRRRALEEAVRTAIRDGRLAGGTRLPSTRDLAHQLGLARGTVTAVYEQLTAEGWLTARQGAGTEVAEGTAVSRPALGAGLPRAAQAQHDLRPGRPDTQAFPRGAWARAMRSVLREAPADAFGFGDPRGRPELRTTLSAYLSRVRGVRVDPEHLVICSGYTQALGLLAEVFVDMGVSVVGMEDPTIGDHVGLMSTRLQVADIPLDGAGLSVEMLRESGAEAVICTPSHQFPIGTCMTPQRRSELLAWAARRRGWIVEDDYDGEFRYDRQPVAALQSRQPERVIYIGSTSKTIGPGVRIGWIACPPRLVEPLAEAKRRTHDWRSMDQLALAHLIDSGDYDRHLRSMRRIYRRRRDILTVAVRNALPDSRIHGIDAGLHAILELPDPTRLGEQEAIEALRAAAILTHPLGDYLRSTEVHYPPALVIGYGTPSERSYEPAIEALRDVLVTARRSPRAASSSGSTKVSIG
ncbi:PLP-dependent aminotransferase family protein [Nocardia sp. NPDC052566]|uniref:MocR-like pyridoxine biosynthesis transcription factor PdxR n=1 Tax=Nocardia sp. NPDC052566 TaxID=3364330 RepID=UPI0037C96A77